MIETGTYRGDTAAYLARSGFQVVTIELSPELAAKARARFAHNPDVEVIEGDSALVLPRVIKRHDEPLCFWLDGHWSGGQTAGIHGHPLRSELDAIRQHPRHQEHVVLIDDVRLFGLEGYPTMEEVRALLSADGRKSSYVLHDILRHHPLTEPTGSDV